MPPTHLLTYSPSATIYRMSTTPPSEPRPPEPSSPTPPAIIADTGVDESAGRCASRTQAARHAGALRRPSPFAAAPPPRVPILLFVATCLSTYWVGAANWKPQQFGTIDQMWQVMTTNWQQGLIYMGAVVAILLTHEMGHFLQTVRYHIPASYPLCIPVPFSLIGTMGAVISMDGMRANRKQIFDIGVAGPLAGLAVAFPILYVGVHAARSLGAADRRTTFSSTIP